jgi:hypothetical protein
MGRVIISNRVDGSCQRLCAIILGYSLAKLYQVDFKFSWPLNTLHHKSIHLSLNDEIDKLFNITFLDEHLENQIAINNMVKCGGNDDLSNLKQPLRRILNDTELASVLNRDGVLISPNRFFPKEIYKYLPAVIKEVLNPIYNEYIQHVKSKTLGIKAIHYRGGDVVYGDWRHDQHATGFMSIPLPVIERYVKDNHSHPMLLFGTPTGKTKRDLEYLLDKYSNLIRASDFYWENLDPVLMDAILMSSCESIFSARGSAVSELARHFNCNISKIVPCDVYETEIIVETLDKYLEFYDDPRAIALKKS